jgi:NADH-quinone oxidoreductase subunit K
MAPVLILFYILAAITLSTAFLTIYSRNPIHSAIYLVLCMVSIMGHYLVFNAQFLALVQLIVYAGAIMVLFLFTIMLMNLNKEDEVHKPRITRLGANVLNQIGIENYIFLSILLFCIGVFGVLYRRNAIIVFMSIEIMLNAVNLLFVAFSTYHQDAKGQVFVFFSMAVAAAEVAVGLALLVSVFRNIGSVDISNLKNLKG